MKNFCLLVFLTFCSLTGFAETSQPMCCSIMNNKDFIQITDDEWIYIGETSLYRGTPGTVGYEQLPAKLYVREIGQKLLFRAEYKGEYYAPRFDASNKSYSVTIDGITYRCDVPSISDDHTSSEQPRNSLIGVWKSTEKGYKDLGDIQISNKDGNFFVQMKKAYGLKSTSATVHNDYIEWSLDLNEEYGTWRIQTYTSVGQIIVGDGYSYTDKKKPTGSVVRERSFANKEVLREKYRGRIKDGNLVLSVSYEFLYYNDGNYCFSCAGEQTIDNVIYTQW